MANTSDWKLPPSYSKFKDEILNWPIDEEDVWICSFPKCGTTWASEMIWLIVNNLNYEAAKSKSLIGRVPYFELSAIFDVDPSLKSDDAVSTCFIESLNCVKNLQKPRCIKTHLPLSLMPLQIQNDMKRPKIIYVVRNELDTCVSYYHHYKMFADNQQDFDDFCQQFLNDQVLYAPFWEHVKSFWAIKERPNVLILRFEEMKRDLKSTIKRVADFLGKALSDNEIMELSKHLSFEEMRNNPAVNNEDILDFIGKFRKTNRTEKFIRSGQVGGYKNEMKSEIIEKFKKWTEENKGRDYLSD